MAAQKTSPVHLAYLVTLTVKGFDGAIEILAGLVILLTGPQRIYRWVVRVTAPELYDGSHVAAVHAIRRGAQHLATSGAHFVEFYLVVHGLLKLALVVVLLRGGGRWIFPVGALILLGFISYMVMRLSEQWSGWLLGFALFDVLTLALVLSEWARSVKESAP
ncbi:MAG TPA: DUF2127 domain-containing protein [Rhizomicrobium sp.]|nr:DUF2127 domain-containing protein [Rhizomicrobium sp.]